MTLEYAIYYLCIQLQQKTQGDVQLKKTAKIVITTYVEHVEQ